VGVSMPNPRTMFAIKPRVNESLSTRSVVAPRKFSRDWAIGPLNSTQPAEHKCRLIKIEFSTGTRIVN
jgi:hypothetical protein